MPQHHQQPFIKHQFCSFNPSCQINSNFDSTCDIEFDYLGARKTQYYEHFSNLDSKEIEFQVLAQKTGDGFDAYFPPLWKTNSSELMEYESSPLLHHHHRNLSPARRSKVIAEGRKELMEMIQNMPETSYELSLKDIVDEQQKQIQPEVQEEIVTEETSFQFQTEEKIKKRMKKKPKAGQISRSGSMDNENFMIKIFFPSFCPGFPRSKKKPTGGNSSKVLDFMDKDWWTKRFFVVGESKYNERNSSSSSSRSRQANGIFSQGCWSLFYSKQNKTRRQRGCIF